MEFTKIYGQFFPGLVLDSEAFSLALVSVSDWTDERFLISKVETSQQCNKTVIT